MTIWQELGIEATEDAGAIKSAYAARLKLTRPEDDPEGFQRLRAAYTAALQRAGQRGLSAVPKPRATEADAAAPEPPADTSLSPDMVELLRARDEAIRSLSRAFEGGDGEEAVAALDAVVARQVLPIDQEGRFVNALVGVLYNDRTIPPRRLLELAKRFGWYGVPDQLRGPNGRAELLLCARIDAEMWLTSTKWLARSWKYWIGERDPAAARIVMGTAPVWLNWIAPPEPLLSRKLAEALLYAPFLNGAVDTDRVDAIQRILTIRRKDLFRTADVVARMAIMLVLTIAGLYFASEAASGVIIAAFVWFRFAGAFRGTYRTELLFPLAALVWVVVWSIIVVTSRAPLIQN